MTTRWVFEVFSCDRQVLYPSHIERHVMHSVSYHFVNIVQFILLLVPHHVCHFSCCVIVCLMYAAQKYMSLMTKPEDPLKVVKMKGLHHVETSSVDAATYLDPTGTRYFWAVSYVLKDSLLCIHCTRGHLLLVPMLLFLSFLPLIPRSQRRRFGEWKWLLK